MSEEKFNSEIDRLNYDIQRLRESLQNINDQAKQSLLEMNNLSRRVKQLTKMSFSSRKEDMWASNYMLTDQIYSSDLIRILQVENYQIGPYTLNTRTRELTGKGNNVKLTQKEMFLLAIFASNLNVFVDRDYCLNTIWRETSYMKSRSMDVYICKIRNYLDDSDVNLVNRHGKGYILLVSNLGEKNILGGK